MPSITDTFLFDRMIFGPIQSRRLGCSLGINLLPVSSKLCNMDCIYCECGWTGTNERQQVRFPSTDKIMNTLYNKLTELREQGICPDTFTFAGNGEPTMHPDFPEILGQTIRARNTYFPKAKVAVLTNAMLLHRKGVSEALMMADLRILKLDAGTDELFQRINQPHSSRKLDDIVSRLKDFHGELIIQSLFLRGETANEPLDNSTDVEVSAWIGYLKEIKPRQVMLYTIDRATPAKGLEKIPKERLFEIASRVNALGIETMVS